ncbi:hypothetical protein [Rubinisphaera italica]|uniref:Uncharacterized protein n=1 Tax=Rubinisphaera italica TaxID=2527969 RepID=A0A5C5XMX3_9PLAN|nr:hypothetical protein [Rubinisphaera italica]TWT63821.1 hypothetical protein Pan54_45800 [Rubinisphaera italica]
METTREGIAAIRRLSGDSVLRAQSLDQIAGELHKRTLRNNNQQDCSGKVDKSLKEQITMGFLKRIIRTNHRDGGIETQRSSFDHLSEEQLEHHLSISRYGSFKLTDAIRPSYNLDVVPSAGYRRDSYQDKDTGVEIPVILAAQSSERLIDLFIDLLDPLGDEVDLILETSHEQAAGVHRDLYRESIDLPVLKSTLFDHEDMLLNDGCTGIAVVNPKIPLEVQFDEHKLILLYGQDLFPFEAILRRHGLDCRKELKFITEAEHVHSSTSDYTEEFEQLCYRLGIES